MSKKRPFSPFLFKLINVAIWVWIIGVGSFSISFLFLGQASYIAFLISLAIGPILLLHLFVLFLLAITKKIVPFSAATVICLINIPIFSKSFSVSWRPNSCQSDLRIMSYNIGSFDPNRYTNYDGDTLNQSAIYSWFKSIEKPDILCMQEFFHGYKADMELSLDSIQSFGQYKYYYMNPGYKKKYEGFFGVITFSKYLAIASGEIKFSESLVNKGIYSDFIIEKDTIRVINIHLSSLSLRFEKPGITGFISDFKNNLSTIVSSHHTHVEEVNKVMEFVDQSPYRVILCGDLNSLPNSYPYRLVSQTLENTFEQGGSGFGNTYHRFPFYARIDHIFIDPGLKTCRFKVLRDNVFSDHFPIQAEINLPSD